MNDEGRLRASEHSGGLFFGVRWLKSVLASLALPYDGSNNSACYNNGPNAYDPRPHIFSSFR